MKHYIEQHGCHDCKFVLIVTDFDQGLEYYCWHDKSKRPLCMSVSMNESPNENFEYQLMRWEEWSKKHKVEAWGLCELWILKT